MGNPDDRNCSSDSVMENSFVSPVTGSNFFYSDLSMELQPMMNNYDTPLSSLLINRYEMLHLEYTKRKVMTYKTTSIDNDKGWFFPDVENESIITTDTVVPDFTFKDKWTQNVLYTSFIYLGNKQDNYIRSYSKIQEVLAAIGGFAKFFHTVIFFVYLYIGNIYKIFTLSEQIQFNEDKFDLKKGEIRDNKNSIYINSPSIMFKSNFNIKRESSKNVKASTSFRNTGVSAFDYFWFKLCGRKGANRRDNLMIEKMQCYERYFNNKMDVVKYIKIHNNLKIMKKLLLNEENRKMLKFVKPLLKSENEKKNVEASSYNIVKNYFNSMSVSGFNPNPNNNDPVGKQIISMMEKRLQNAYLGKIDNN
jgi:hypothetical protein